jgi:hypothetical protein
VLARTWVRLAWALSAPDDAARVAAARDVEAWLRERLAAEPVAAPEKPARAERAPREEAPVVPAPSGEPHPLERLVGGPVPSKWRERLEVLEAFAAAHPGQIDTLAARALEHHVAVSGERSPAPWLATIVSQALAAGEAPETRSTLGRLRDRGAFAVSLYGEAPFAALVGVRRLAAERGLSTGGLRRGVLSRGEPAERRVWTLRVEADGVERLIAAAPADESPWEGDLAARIAERLPELCPRVVLYAPGGGNAALREAAVAAGVSLADSAEASDLLDRALAVSEAERPRRREEVLSELLAGGVPDHGALTEAISSYDRVFKAFRVAERTLDAREDGEADAARAAFLRAADAVAPPQVHVPEGTTWAVALAARGVAAELALGGRYGGPGADGVVHLARALAEAGRPVHRVLLGATRRERQRDPALRALEGELGGLWRLKTEAGGEVAYLSDLTPEGRAAATRLLMDDRPRVAVIPVDGDLLSWWRAAGGADPIGWTGDEGADVAEALSRLAPAADDAAEPDGEGA